MNATDLKAGQVVIFTPTGVEFTISLVTEKRISWWTGFTCKSSWGKNNMRKAFSSIKTFQSGINDGTYVIKNN